MIEVGNGYRALIENERLEDGDEYWSMTFNSWQKTSTPDRRIGKSDVGMYRRKIEPAKDIVSSTIDERGKIYGEPQESMTNIGVAWTAILQQHFGITLPNAIPPWVVANMLVAFKLQRTLKGWHEDNYIDAEAYLRFAKEGQKK